MIEAAERPAVKEVVALVRMALHDTDPINRAEARVMLEQAGLPVSPQAIILAGHR